MLSKDILGIYEAYSKMYQPTNSPEEVVEEEIDGLVEEVIGELFEECIEEGYTIDEAAVAIEEAATEYFDEAKITYGSDTESPEQRRARAQAKVGEKRSAARKAAVKGAVERVKAKAKGAKAAAGIAGSIAKDEARRAGRAAKQAVVGAVEKKKKEVKSGIKGFLGKAAKKVASKASSVAARLGEETQQVDVFDFVQEFLCVEGYADDLDHAEWMMANIINEEAIEIILNLEDLDEGVKEVADRIVAAAKAGSARHTAAMKGAEDAKKRHDASVKKLGSALKPAADTAKSAASGAAKVARGVGGAIKKGVELERKGAAAVHTLGKKMNAAKKAFTKEDLDAWLEEAYRSAEENSKRYDRARKRAAQRAAARNAARDAGQTGAVPGVGYVTPRREKETYTDSAGKTRHAKGL